MRWLIAVAGLVAALAGAWFWFAAASFQPGAGAAYQTAPDSVAAGGEAEISLRLAVWGEGGPAAMRYRDVRLSIGAPDAPDWQTLAPSQTLQAADGITYRFVVKAPGAPGAVLAYRFTFVFDGSPSTVEGLKRLAVR